MRRAVGLSVAVVVLLAGCASSAESEPESAAVESAPVDETEETEESEPEPEPEPEEEPAGDFCAAIADAGSDLAVLDEGSMAEAMASDPVGTFERSLAAAERIEPPAELAAGWQALTDVSRAYVDGLAGVDAGDPDALNAALGVIAAEQDPADFEAIATLGTQIADECGSESSAGGAEGSAGAVDLCSMLGMQDLSAVFGLSFPEPEAADYGAGFQECVWEDGEKTVRVSLLPMADLQADYLDGAETQDMAGRPGMVGFPGVAGIGHASSGGWTVAFETASGGVLVGVRTDGGTNADAVAGEIADLLAAQL